MKFSSERGSIMLLGIGFTGVCLLALAVVTDASSAFIQQRNLQSYADSIALAGAQGIDRSEYYRSGATESTRLDPQVVRSTIEGQIRAFDVPNQPRVEFSSNGTAVSVFVKAPLRLTFFDTLPFDPVVVSATARLDYREPE
ncbi:MAG: Tad domain-containing protein [Candidatus Nanopelagicales bacterium]